MIRREQGAEGSIIKMERFLSLCIIRFLSYYVLSVWGPRAGIIYILRFSRFFQKIGIKPILVHIKNILEGTVKISVKNHPDLEAQINFWNIFLKKSIFQYI